MYYNEPPRVDSIGESTPEHNTSSSIITVIVLICITAFILAGAMYGMFLWGQSSARKAALNSSSSSSIISNSSSSVANQSSPSQSQSSSVSIPVKEGVFADEKFPGFTFSYDPVAWNIEKKNTFNGEDSTIAGTQMYARAITLTHKTSQTRLRLSIQKNVPFGMVGHPCYSEDMMVDIGDGWYRALNADGSRVFSNKLIKPVDTNFCKDSKSQFAQLDTFAQIKSGGYLTIGLELQGQERTLADSIVKSIVL